MTRRRFEFEEDGSRKFWEVSVEGSALTTRFGRLGTDGQTKTKSLDSSDAAEREAAKLVTEKTRKGYREVTGGAAASGPAEAPPPDGATTRAASLPAGESIAAAPKPKKPAKGATWKPFTINGRHFALAPDGAFAVVAGLPVNVDGAFKMSFTIHDRSGATKQVATPGTVRGLAVFADGRIVASIHEDYPSRSPRTYETAGIALYDSSGTLLRTIASVEYAGAEAITIDRTHGRVAFRAVPMDTAHPRYLEARLVVLDPNAPDAAATVVEFDKTPPVFGFDDQGVLWALGSKRGVHIDRDGTVHELPDQTAVCAAPAVRSDHLGFSAAGNRIAFVAHLDAVQVVENGAVKFEIPVNIVERVFLVENGRTLVTAASATKARLGPAALEVAQWPDADPALRETNLAAWDVETGALKKAVAIGGATLNGVAFVEGEYFAVNTTGRAAKIEFVPWSALLGA